MTIEWCGTTHPGLGVLFLAGHLGPEAAARFTGAIGWVLARAPGVILDLTALRGWSAGGQVAVTQSARLHPRAFGPVRRPRRSPARGEQRQWCRDAWPGEPAAAI
ncbi:anti-sigma factor antagonist [Streptomyces sp. ME08-AFT2]|uniref:anti-sigma factor antagonist n=1 Tax=Streptomyces TaxID=1883 RepID=UPI0015C5114A|nr:MULTISPECIES: anti-sigma factor antagonist [Streptomyces]MDX2758857.1 anti-sigma factor antagonist [Streptomyces europaeiscabiei]MDX3314842.1 anti-sigma factor antagonist [Streptomyces sp. ME08-AFT2]MDX3632513.1 anti-sigma factor antagonist [Streptomyces europaeiscabiei]MDX3646796.1 anti-sigma factor antagonist [Streptomyces europaeiscabiei]